MQGQFAKCPPPRAGQRRHLLQRSRPPFSKRFLLALFFLPFSANSVLFDPLSIEALTRHSDLVVQGTVASKTVLRDDQDRIYTQVELYVQDVWKGSPPGNPLRIVHGGGTLGQQSSIVSGQAEYQVNEEVVAFLVLNQRGEAVTLGLAQGKFQVWKDQMSGEKLARNLFHGTPGQSKLGIQTRTSPRLTLEGLKNMVREAQR